jgi:hypothetical protein
MTFTRPHEINTYEEGKHPQAQYAAFLEGYNPSNGSRILKKGETITHFICIFFV